MTELGSQSQHARYGNVPNSTRKRPLHLMHSQYPLDLRRRATTRQVDRCKVSRACDACKKRKTRCSGVQPCIRCHEWSIPCEYTAVYTRGRRPNIPTASQPSPNAAEVEQADKLSAYQPTDSSLQAQSPYMTLEHDKATLTGQSSRNSPVPNADIQGHYHGPSSPLTFLERAWKRINRSHASTFLSNLESESNVIGRVSDSHTLVQAERLIDPRRLPSQQCAMQLIERHFEITTPLYRFLHRGVVESWVKLVYQDSDGSVNLHRRQSSARKLAVLLMIFAEATFYGEDTGEQSPCQRIHQSEEYYADACHHLQDDLGYPTLESVQARLVECFYLLSTPRENEVYSKFGVLVSMAITIGLHRRKRRNGYKHEIGVLEQECRKRAFWAIYILDRYLSVMGGRPRLLLDRDLDQGLPASLNDDALDSDCLEPRARAADSVMNAPNAHAKLACIIGRNSHEMYPLQANTLDERIACVKRSTQALETWASELPVLFREVAPSSLSCVFRRQCVMIRIAHAHAVIHANRPFLLNQFSAMKYHMISRGQSFNGCVDNCVMAARGVLESLESFTEDDTIFQALWFVQYVSFCAIAVIYIHIMVERQRRKSQPDNTDVADSTAYLSTDQDLCMTERWQNRLAQAARSNSPGQKYAIILEEIRHEVVCYEEPAPSASISAIDGLHEQDRSNVSANVSPFDSQNAGVQEETSFAADNDMNLTQMFDSWGLLDYAQLDYAVPSSALESQP